MKAAARIASSVAGWLAMSVAFALLLALGVGPRFGAYRTVTVLTGSMNPSIPAGSVVVVTPQSPRDIRIGQVITYQIPAEDHRIVSHRVVKVTDPGDHPVIQTKGDANNGPDPWLARISDRTVWRVRFTIPMLGRAIIGLRSPLAHRLTVLVLPAILALIWLRDIWRPKAAAHA